MSNICKFFQQGQCRNGSRCNFSHGNAGYHSGHNEPRFYSDYYGNPTSPNRVWVNPNSRYEQSYQHYQQDRYQHYEQPSQYDRRSGYDNYNSRQYNSNSSRPQSHRQHQKENFAPQSSSTFSFTKALASVKSSSNSNIASEQSSLQQRVKPLTSSPAASSFSFVKALQESNKTQPGPGNSEFYSAVEILSKEEKMQFENAEFTWGRIPLLPPCAEYC